ncbi:hypothetical protein PV379_42335, partial [Streptomyces caniscabiei]|nr:hypothetical protein [Streptomyces caniscabiei]
SEGRARSYRLAERGARLTTRGVSLARFRALRPLRHPRQEVREQLVHLAEEGAQGAEAGQ